MNEWQDILGASALLLFAASLFEVLLDAFTFTAEAGTNRLAEKHPAIASRLRPWLPERKWNRLTTSLLFFSVVCKVVSGMLAGALLYHFWSSFPQWCIVGFFIYVVLFLFFLKLIPPILAEHFSDRITLKALRMTIVLAWIIWPISRPLSRLEFRLVNRIRTRSQDDDRPSTEEEILSLVEQQDNNPLEQEERDIIRSVFEFNDTVCREIMTPRVKLETIDAAWSIAQSIEAIRETSHSRFPVFGESLDEILGVIHVKELLRSLADEHAEVPVTSLIKRKPLFIPETSKINDLLKKMRSETVQVAIVVDEYGGTAGIITIEDIIEELVGEIEDEYDTTSPRIRKLTSGNVVIDPSMSVSEANDELNLQFPLREEYDAIAGLLLHHFGRIPQIGEQYSDNNGTLIITKANERHIEEIKFIPAQKPKVPSS